MAVLIITPAQTNLSIVRPHWRFSAVQTNQMPLSPFPRQHDRQTVPLGDHALLPLGFRCLSIRCRLAPILSADGAVAAAGVVKPGAGEGEAPFFCHRSQVSGETQNSAAPVSQST